MAKKQTRRAVGLKPETYDKVKNYCDDQGLSMSGFIEQLVTAFFSDDPSPQSNKPGSEPVQYASDGPIRGGGVHNL